MGCYQWTVPGQTMGRCSRKDQESFRCQTAAYDGEGRRIEKVETNSSQEMVPGLSKWLDGGDVVEKQVLPANRRREGVGCSCCAFVGFRMRPPCAPGDTRIVPGLAAWEPFLEHACPTCLLFCVRRLIHSKKTHLLKK